MPTPYRYRITHPETELPAYPDFIADVLEATDTRQPHVDMDVGVRAQMYRDALCAIQASLADRSDEPLNRYAERHFNAGQS